MSQINLNGAFITHKVFGTGQILETENGQITVLFNGNSETKKFMFPAAIETFLKLEDAETASQFREFAAAVSRDDAMARKDEDDRLAAEKFAHAEHAKKLKKAAKKATKPTKKSVAADTVEIL